jgi:hypothetical protein
MHHVPLTLRRGLRLIAVTLVAMLAYRFLEPRGQGFWVLIALVVIGLGWVALRARVLRRRRLEDAREDRWAEALLDASKRPAMREELRRDREALDTRHKPHAHARLSLLLAELLDADGERSEARRVLAGVDRNRLGGPMLATVLHARASLCVAEGDADAAEALLATLPEELDEVMEARIEVLRGGIALERGDAEAALEIAADVRDRTRDRDVRVETQLLKATALDALEDREDALRVMRALDGDTLTALAALGFPRVKPLAEAALAAE